MRQERCRYGKIIYPENWMLLDHEVDRPRAYKAVSSYINLALHLCNQASLSMCSCVRNQYENSTNGKPLRTSKIHKGKGANARPAEVHRDFSIVVIGCPGSSGGER